MVEIKDDENSQNLKLPKNIRQVGQTEGKIRIYVEDYVVTFLSQLAQEMPQEERLAILLGYAVKDKGQQYVFVHGAIAVENINIQEDHIGFTSGIWSKIYDDIKNYFGDAKVIGWFMTRPGKTLKITDKIIRIHGEYFPGEGKTIFVVDPLEHDEQFYIYYQGKLQIQKGYYIYYERNETMQNYMVEYHQGKKVEKPLKQIEDETKKSRTKLTPQIIRQKRKVLDRSAGYAAALLVLLAAASAVTVVHRLNPDLNWHFLSSSKNEVEKESILQDETDLTEPETYISSWAEEGETEESTEAVSVMATALRGTRYTVAEGDTLAKISLHYYQSLDYVDAICQLNDISDANYIYPGMTIVLP